MFDNTEPTRETGYVFVGMRRTWSPTPGVRLTLFSSRQWLVLCSPNQKPQDGRRFAQR
jgi:hypothetical protein